MRLFFVFMFFSVVAFGQNKVEESSNRPLLNTNNLNFGVGYGAIAFIANVSYQRLKSHKKICSVFSAGLDFVRIDFFSTDQFLVPSLRYGILTGLEKKHHFEVNAGPGLAVYIDGSPYESNFILGFNIGYRNQKPDSPIVFRTGIGFPECLYVSFGYSF